MAVEKRMIELFEVGQVKALEGKRIVSYGMLSYGYDVCCSTEFKIFININSIIVDLKNFDEKNFVDYCGEVVHCPVEFVRARVTVFEKVIRIRIGETDAVAF